LDGDKQEEETMGKILSQSDERFIRELLDWDSGRRSLDWLLCNIALVVAALVIIGVGVMTLRYMTDRVIFGLLVPGFVVGLFLVGLYVFGGKRIRERHRVAEIVRKLSQAA
jgi:hypothetical protein